MTLLATGKSLFITPHFLSILLFYKQQEIFLFVHSAQSILPNRSPWMKVLAQVFQETFFSFSTQNIHWKTANLFTDDPGIILRTRAARGHKFPAVSTGHRGHKLLMVGAQGLCHSPLFSFYLHHVCSNPTWSHLGTIRELLVFEILWSHLIPETCYPLEMCLASSSKERVRRSEGREQGRGCGEKH